MAASERTEDRHAAARKEPRTILRDPVGFPITITEFCRLHRHDITVYGTDISSGGIGITSSTPIAPGFVWLWRSVGNQHGGMVMWCRKIDGRYRAGIQFLQTPVNVDDLLKTSD
jgi:hypothetical protein